MGSHFEDAQTDSYGTANLQLLEGDLKRRDMLFKMDRLQVCMRGQETNLPVILSAETCEIEASGPV